MSGDEKKVFRDSDPIPPRKSQKKDAKRHIKTHGQLKRVMGVIQSWPTSVPDRSDVSNLLLIVENLPEEMITPERRDALARAVHSLPFIAISGEDKVALQNDFVDLYRDAINTPYDVLTMMALKTTAALESVKMSRSKACQLVEKEGCFNMTAKALKQAIKRDRRGFYSGWLADMEADQSDKTNRRLFAAIIINTHCDEETFIRHIQQTPEEYERHQSINLGQPFTLDGLTMKDFV